MPDLHFHDLRNTGNMLAAETGANLRGPLERMGHSSTRAALIYLHGNAARDRAIADGLSNMIDKRRPPEPDEHAGHADEASGT